MTKHTANVIFITWEITQGYKWTRASKYHESQVFAKRLVMAEKFIILAEKK